MYTLITGTRPQIIKSIPIIKEAKERDIQLDHIHTGQHYDFEMYDIFVREFSLPKPRQLQVDRSSELATFSSIISELGETISNSNVRAIIVPGDTNSALAAALAGFNLNIPVCHVEAGLRSKDLRMQEEINRRLIDHGSSLLFVPTRTAEDTLRTEDVLGEVLFVGDTMWDLLLNTELQNATISLPSENFAVLTLHRKENVDSKERLAAILEGLGRLNFNILFPIHPRTSKMIQELEIITPNNLTIVEPLGYPEFLGLISKSSLVITDSGGLQKETYLLNKPCVTLRNSTEWEETLVGGANILVGANLEKIYDECSRMYGKRLKNDSSVYGDGKAAVKIVDRLEVGNIEIPTVKEI